MTPPKELIRKATLEDAETIIAFNMAMAQETEHLTLPEDVLRKGVKNGISDPSKASYFVTEVEGSIIASLMITYEWSDWRNASVWWVQSVYVQPEHRRRGVYSRMYAHVKQLAKQDGAIGVRLYTEHENHSAKATYEKLGMVSRYTMYEDLLTDY